MAAMMAPSMTCKEVVYLRVDQCTTWGYGQRPGFDSKLCAETLTDALLGVVAPCCYALVLCNGHSVVKGTGQRAAVHDTMGYCRRRLTSTFVRSMATMLWGTEGPDLTLAMVALPWVPLQVPMVGLTPRWSTTSLQSLQPPNWPLRSRIRRVLLLQIHRIQRTKPHIVGMQHDATYQASATFHGSL